MKRIAITSAVGAALLGSTISIAPISSADAQARYVGPPSSRLVVPPSRLAPGSGSNFAPPPRAIGGGIANGGRLVTDNGAGLMNNRGNLVSDRGGGFRPR